METRSYRATTCLAWGRHVDDGFSLVSGADAPGLALRPIHPGERALIAHAGREVADAGHDVLYGVDGYFYIYATPDFL